MKHQDQSEYLVGRWRGGWLWHLDDSRSGVEMHYTPLSVMLRHIYIVTVPGSSEGLPRIT